MDREPNTEYILSLSYGKDSIACLFAIEQLGWPLDRIVHAEVWATDTIPADPPPMVEFKAKADQMQREDEGIVHPYTKRTGLWLVGLDPLVPTSPNAVPVGPYVPSGTGRKDRSKYGAAKRGEDAKNRAKTFPGIARAMAEQWAGPVKNVSACQSEM